MRGLLKGSFALVEFPHALLAGFALHLERLQELAGNPRIAFEDIVSISNGSSKDFNSPPVYAMGKDFAYNLNSIRSEAAIRDNASVKVLPSQESIDTPESQRVLRNLRQNTTLDDGQALALYESLNRKMAFTQGPPGTGKSYLGVSLAQVILESQPPKDPKPILVVCMTNHALDSFLDDLVKKNFRNMVRLGAGSKEKWTDEFLMMNQARQMKLTKNENWRRSEAHHQVETLARYGAGWAGAFNKTYQLGWYAIQDHLKNNHREFFDTFSKLEKVNLGGTDIRRVKCIAGFGYQFWLDGGDINNMKSLVKVVESLLDDGMYQDLSEVAAARFRERLFASIEHNVSQVSPQNNIWSLALEARRELAEKWTKEIDCHLICDAMAEMHRRHQSTLAFKSKVYSDINARCLAQSKTITL